SASELDEGTLDIVVAGTESGIMMVEAGANEASEDDVIAALEYGHTTIQPAIKLQKELVKKIGVTPQQFTLELPDQDMQQRVDTWLEGKLGTGLRAPYPERNDLVKNLREQMKAHFTEELGDDFGELAQEYDDAFTMALHKDVRKGIVEEQIRP